MPGDRLLPADPWPPRRGFARVAESAEAAAAALSRVGNPGQAERHDRRTAAALRHLQGVGGARHIRPDPHPTHVVGDLDGRGPSVVHHPPADRRVGGLGGPHPWGRQPLRDRPAHLDPRVAQRRLPGTAGHRASVHAGSFRHHRRERADSRPGRRSCPVRRSDLRPARRARREQARCAAALACHLVSARCCLHMPIPTSRNAACSG